MSFTVLFWNKPEWENSHDITVWIFKYLIFSEALPIKVTATLCFSPMKEQCLSSSLSAVCLVKYLIWTHSCCTCHYCITLNFKSEPFLFSKFTTDQTSQLQLLLKYLKLPLTATKVRAAINRMQTKQYTVMQFQKHDLRTSIYNWPIARKY